MREAYEKLLSDIEAARFQIKQFENETRLFKRARAATRLQMLSVLSQMVDDMYKAQRLLSKVKK